MEKAGGGATDGGFKVSGKKACALIKELIDHSGTHTIRDKKPALDDGETNTAPGRGTIIDITLNPTRGWKPVVGPLRPVEAWELLLHEMLHAVHYARTGDWWASDDIPGWATEEYKTITETNDIVKADGLTNSDGNPPVPRNPLGHPKAEQANGQYDWSPP